MGYLAFYLAVITACLLWSATFTAAAARTDRAWLRRLLVTVAVVVPLAALLPWVMGTGMLAFAARLETNWFAPTVTAFLSALIGGVWIVRAGLSPAAVSSSPAAGWPLIGLAAMFLVAKAVTAGILLLIDNAVAAQAPYLRLEAAALMQENLPPSLADADNAASLYGLAIAALDADPSLGQESEPLNRCYSIDVDSAAVTELLARHAATLDVLRRATDRKSCRFVRDWTRPSISTLLPELEFLRQSCRLLALAARREAATGDTRAALHDILRIRRLAAHVAEEPILVSGLVTTAIDATALTTLADVLPRLTKADLPALDAPAFRDFVKLPFTMQRQFQGEEAFGLSLFADLADGRSDISILRVLGGGSVEVPPVFAPLTVLYRSFMLPRDITAYRTYMAKFHKVAVSAAGMPPRSYPEVKKQADVIEQELLGRRPGIATGSLVPAYASVLRTQAQAQARHRAAEVLVAATRVRLTTGSVPESIAALVPEGLAVVPRDPFTTDQPLLTKRADDVWIVYSVGPDGEDDGGPVAPGADAVQGNDDIGLRLAL